MERRREVAEEESDAVRLACGGGRHNQPRELRSELDKLKLLLAKQRQVGVRRRKAPGRRLAQRLADTGMAVLDIEHRIVL